MYDKKMQADHKTIERLCTEYSGLIRYSSPHVQRQQASVERCKLPDFPWAAEEREGMNMQCHN